MNDEDYIDLDDIKERYWDRYLSFCRAESRRPDLSDFEVWYDELTEESYDLS